MRTYRARHLFPSCTPSSIMWILSLELPPKDMRNTRRCPRPGGGLSQRTIPALHRHGLLRKQSRRDGPPVLWLPELMDMQADEAVRRAGWLADHKDEDPQNYFRAGNGKVADCALARGASERARGGIDVESEPERRIRSFRHQKHNSSCASNAALNRSHQPLQMIGRY